MYTCNRAVRQPWTSEYGTYILEQWTSGSFRYITLWHFSDLSIVQSNFASSIHILTLPGYFAMSKAVGQLPIINGMYRIRNLEKSSYIELTDALKRPGDRIAARPHLNSFDQIVSILLDHPSIV